MRQFHQILAQYTPLVEGYVLDARRTRSGDVLVQLTVLVHPGTSTWLRGQIWSRLSTSEDKTDLWQIATDFDIDDTGDSTIAFVVLVKRLAASDGARHA